MIDTEHVTYIFGSGRCGSTLLARLLNHFPYVESIYEVSALPRWLNFVRRREVPRDSDYRIARNEALELLSDPGIRLQVSIDELDVSKTTPFAGTPATWRSFAGLVKLWLDRIHTLQMRRAGAMRIVHKTPALSLYVRELGELWPHSRWIHVIRDPRDVIGSYLAQEFGPATVDEGIDWYCSRVGMALNAGHSDPRMLLIRFEDLVQYPEREISRICGHINLASVMSEAFVNCTPDPQRIGKSRRHLSASTQDRVWSTVVERIPMIQEIYPDS